MQIEAKFSIKDGASIDNLRYLCPSMLIIFANFSRLCFFKKLPVILTNIINEKIPGISVSTTHEEGRAIDISVNGWTNEQIEAICLDMNSRFDKWGTAPPEKKRQVAYFHNGTAPHIHLQVNRYLDNVINNNKEVNNGTST